MEHRGEIFKKVVEDLGANKTKLAKYIGYSREHLYQLFKDPDLSWEILRKAGSFLKHDFREEFPRMPKGPSIAEEPTSLYTINNLTDCKTKLMEYQTKYYQLLARHNDLLEKMLFERGQ